MADGSVLMSAAVPITISTETPIAQLFVSPGSNVVLRTGERIELQVSGTLAGADARISMDMQDVLISYSTTGIVEIVGNELVAISEGEVVITLRRGTAVMSVEVAVTGSDRSPRRRAVRH
jgi:hypothetical protein